jgi:predicted RNase H-like HicB family nuclease
LRYTAVFEIADRNYAAYVPDLPGCVATGTTRPEVERRIRKAIEVHVEELRKKEQRVPKAAGLE